MAKSNVGKIAGIVKGGVKMTPVKISPSKMITRSVTPKGKKGQF